MTGIYIADIDAIQDLEDYLPAFVNGFHAECRQLRESILETAYEIEMRLDEAQEEYDSAFSSSRGGDDDDSSWESEGAADAAADRLAEWNSYKQRYDNFADRAISQIDEAQAAQDRAVSLAVSLLSRMIESAKTIRAVTISSEHSPQIDDANPSAQGASTIQGTSILHSARLPEQLPPLPNGLTWVPVDRLDWSSIPEDIAFKKAKHDEIAAMLEVFEREVLPAVFAQGLQHNDLVNMDRRDGRTIGASSRAFAYEYMIGFGRSSDVIAVNAPHAITGNRVTWESGRHRAMVARELGWNFVPARVIGGTL